MAYVYRHIRTDLNAPFYIGIGAVSADLKNYCYHKRAFNRAQRSQRWKNIANKTEIEVEILIDDISYDEAKKKEIEFIHLYKRVEDGGTLVNLTEGGDGTIGVFPSEETRKKLSAIRKGRPSHLKGRKLSEEQCKKLSLVGKGRPSHRKGKKIPRDVVDRIALSLTGKIPVQQFQNNVFLFEYVNATEASRKTGLRKASIISALNGHAKTYKGYVWKYKSPDV